MKSLFELMGGTYTEVDGIFYPNLALPEPDPRPIGKWGRLHEAYLKKHQPITYTSLLTTCNPLNHTPCELRVFAKHFFAIPIILRKQENPGV